MTEGNKQARVLATIKQLERMKQRRLWMIEAFESQMMKKESESLAL